MADPIVLLLAAILDRLVGDPWNFPHPVQFIGYLISWLTRFSLHRFSSPWGQRWAGIGVTLISLAIPVGLSWLLLQSVYQFSELLANSLAVIMIASCFAEKSLEDAARSVLVPLNAGNLVEARSLLSRYVGRDTANLSETEILRAVLETVAENCTDGVIAPLFYAILGGAPLAVGYKVLSTLDSMIGYKSAPYTYIGWCSARSEDIATWLPCRYTVLLIGILSGHPIELWRLCWQDAHHDPSPNSGWSECAFAAALGVQLGGTNFYQGVPQQKPLLAVAKHPITPAKVLQAMALMRAAFWITIGVGVTLKSLCQSSFRFS